MGIFFANIHMMHSSAVGVDEFEIHFGGWKQDLARRFDQIFVYGKFYSIFSFLFGIGVAIQAGRQSDKRWRVFQPRRMLALFAFGVMHITFLWSGDVLHLYAAFGLVGMVLIRLPWQVLAVSGVFAFAFPYYAAIFEALADVVSFDPDRFTASGDAVNIRETFVNGSFIEMVHLRWQQYASNLPMLSLHLAPNAFAMFLLGVAFAKSVALDDLGTLARRFTGRVLLAAIVVTTYRVYFLFFLWETPVWKDEDWRPLLIRLMEVSDSLTGLLYLWGLTIVHSHRSTQFVVTPLKYVGRMALTNYLLQSLLGTLLFTGFGLGFYESYSPFALFSIVWIVIVIQLLLSKLWFAFFRFGPFEWVWRCVSYGQVFSLKTASRSDSG